MTVSGSVLHSSRRLQMSPVPPPSLRDLAANEEKVFKRVIYVFV